MIRPLDSWTLRRLLVGLPVNGELEALDAPFGRLGQRLTEMPLEGRPPALEAFLDARDDRAAIKAALAEADPTGPAPSPEAGDPADDWPPLRYESPPPVEPFPLDVLPAPAARLAEAGSRAIGCALDFIAAFILAVAAGAIGRSVSLLLKRGYFASSTVFIAGVGPPSDGKTPALKLAAGSIRRIDRSLALELEQAMVRWQEEAEMLGADGKKSKPPPRPKRRRIDVDDITMEALPQILAHNSRGLLMPRDELTALFMGMNQFKGGKGNDRAVILKIWAGDDIKKDRVGHEENLPIVCPHPSLSILGGVTPDMLGSMVDAKGRADGFVERFLFVQPDPRPIPEWSEEGVDDETFEGWCDLVARLWQRPMNVKDREAVPHVACFTPEGRAAWEGHYNAHAAEMNSSDFPPRLRGAWGKLREYGGRLALILACLDHAADPTADPFDVPAVGPRIVEGAWRLVAYFKSHARRVHATISLGPDVGGGYVVKAIVDWIRAGHRATFTVRDLKQARRWIEEDDLDEALAHLVDRNAIRPPVESGDRPKVGRPSSRYEVNPALLNSRNTQNARNPPPSTEPDGHTEGFEHFEN